MDFKLNISIPVSPSHFHSSMSQNQHKWQRYIDEALILTGQVSEAAIHGLDGTRMASSPNLSVSVREFLTDKLTNKRSPQVSKDQIHSLMACITGDESALRKNGIKVGNDSYVYLKSNPGRSVFGRLGTDAGLVVFMTNKVILIGTFKPGIQPGNCAYVVEKLSDYIAKCDSA